MDSTSIGYVQWLSLATSSGSYWPNLKVKGIDCLSHYVLGKFSMAANGLNLLENVDDCIYFCKCLWIWLWVGALLAILT